MSGFAIYVSKTTVGAVVLFRDCVHGHEMWHHELFFLPEK